MSVLSKIDVNLNLQCVLALSDARPCDVSFTCLSKLWSVCLSFLNHVIPHITYENAAIAPAGHAVDIIAEFRVRQYPAVWLLTSQHGKRAPYLPDVDRGFLDHRERVSKRLIPNHVSWIWTHLFCSLTIFYKKLV